MSEHTFEIISEPVEKQPTDPDYNHNYPEDYTRQFRQCPLEDVKYFVDGISVTKEGYDLLFHTHLASPTFPIFPDGFDEKVQFVLDNHRKPDAT